MQIHRNRLEIAMARKTLNFSQLAEVSGISRNTLSCVRNGKSCTPDVAGKIAKALGVDPSELIEKEAH